MSTKKSFITYKGIVEALLALKEGCVNHADNLLSMMQDVCTHPIQGWDSFKTYPFTCIVKTLVPVLHALKYDNELQILKDHEEGLMSLDFEAGLQLNAKLLSEALDHTLFNDGQPGVDYCKNVHNTVSLVKCFISEMSYAASFGDELPDSVIIPLHTNVETTSVAA